MDDQERERDREGESERELIWDLFLHFFHFLD